MFNHTVSSVWGSDENYETHRAASLLLHLDSLLTLLAILPPTAEENEGALPRKYRSGVSIHKFVTEVFTGGIKRKGYPWSD